MYLTCQGTGAPTGILVSGRADQGDIWQTVADGAHPQTAVFPGVSKSTRVCAHDRPSTVTIAAQHADASRCTPVPQLDHSRGRSARPPRSADRSQAPRSFRARRPLLGWPDRPPVRQHVPCASSRSRARQFPHRALYDGLTPQQRSWWLALNSNYSPDLDPYHQERTDFLPSFQAVRTAPAPRPIPAVILASDQPYNLESLAAEGQLPTGIPSISAQ